MFSRLLLLLFSALSRLFFFSSIYFCFFLLFGKGRQLVWRRCLYLLEIENGFRGQMKYLSGGEPISVLQGAEEKQKVPASDALNNTNRLIRITRLLLPDNIFDPPVPFRGLEEFPEFRRIINEAETPVNRRQELPFPLFFFLFIKELVGFGR